MNIGFYKIGKKIYFKDNEDDHASWSTEVIRTMDLFHVSGHNIYIVSDTDYDGDVFKTEVDCGKLDRIYVFNGVGDAPLNVFSMSNDVRLIVTDLALVPKDSSRYTHIYSQSKQVFRYCGLETLPVTDIRTSMIEDKSIRFYFGGTERGRTATFLDYVIRPGHEWHGKSHTLDVRSYIPFHKHIEKLKKTKYTIVIGDEAYNKVGFVTPRYYECLAYDVLPFVDKGFDKDRLISIPSELIVDGYADLYKKMTYYDMHEAEYEDLLQKAKELAILSTQNGNLPYTLLNNE